MATQGAFSTAYSSAYASEFAQTAVTGSGGWQKLLDIGKQNAQEQNDWLREQPVACPYDGFPLNTGPQGQLHCPMGDYTRPSGWNNELG